LNEALLSQEDQCDSERLTNLAMSNSTVDIIFRHCQVKETDNEEKKKGERRSRIKIDGVEKNVRGKI